MIKDLRKNKEGQQESYRPVFFDLSQDGQGDLLKQLLDTGEGIQIVDEIESQLKEWIKLSNPAEKLKAAQINSRFEDQFGGKDLDAYGKWVYYPWKRSLVHVLPESQFIEVRTNRNRYKITASEQAVLQQKTIAIIGLSVGQAIATTLALERVCGTIRLADFDTLELSNMNRLKASVDQLGLKKTIIAARNIAEMDPYLHVEVEHDGIHEGNIDSFLLHPQPADLLIEVCDGLDVKVLCREVARTHRIPVVMDTNDRGMLDIERFDLEPNRPLFHGIAGELNPASLKGLTNEEKIPVILKLVGADLISTRLKASMLEVDQSITTWPQLASSVMLGGAVTTDVCRRILLNQLSVSGRFYVDLDQLIADPQPESRILESLPATVPPLTWEGMRRSVSHMDQHLSIQNTLLLSESELNQLAEAVVRAPSAGNNQPWKWLYRDGKFYLFHDRARSLSWGDYAEMGALLSLGCAIETFQLQARGMGYDTQIAICDDATNPHEVAVATIVSHNKTAPDAQLNLLINGLGKRVTNRLNNPATPLKEELWNGIRTYTELSTNAKFHSVTDPHKLKQLAEIIASCDRIRLLVEEGHSEFYHELRWTPEEAAYHRDGVDLASANLKESEKAGFYMAKDYNAIRYLYEWNLGNGFKKMSLESMEFASGMGLITVPGFDRKTLIESGAAVLRSWIYACSEHIAVYPMLSPVFFFNRLKHGKGKEIPQKLIPELQLMMNTFWNIFELSESEYPVFLYKTSMAEKQVTPSLRKNTSDVFRIDA